MTSAPTPSPRTREPGEAQLPPSPPSFWDLLWANLKVLLIAAAVAGVAFGIWRGLAALFPEMEWLQLAG